jgi:hypothetical protein
MGERISDTASALFWRTHPPSDFVGIEEGAGGEGLGAEEFEGVGWGTWREEALPVPWSN